MDIDALAYQGFLDTTFPLPVDRPFTYAMALDAGLKRLQLTRLHEEGLVWRPIKGVYLPTQVGDSLGLRVQCLRLVVPSDCVVVDRHAGWLLGAQMVLAPGEHLDLRPLSLFRPAGHGRLRNELVDSGERTLASADVMEVNGLRVTTPIRTAWDLGRVRWTDQAISGLDAMFRLGEFTREEFLAGIPRFGGTRWVTTLRAIGPLADGRSESPGESVLRLRCIENHLPGMVPQVEVWRGGAMLARLDLADEELMLAVEYDGAEWHSSPEQQEHDRSRRADAVDAGWMVRAFTKDNVFGRHRDVDEQLATAKRDALHRRGRRSTA
jgi:hypothetical protein